MFGHRESFEQLSEDAYDVITVMSGSKELEAVKETYREKGEKINMCEAIRGMIEDGRLEGKLEAEQIVAKNMYLRGMTEEDVAGFCDEEIELVRGWLGEWKKVEN